MEADLLKQTRLVYVLYLIGALVWPFMLAGVIIAYIQRNREVDSLIVTHSHKQIRVFWIHFLFASSAVVVIPSAVVFCSVFAFALAMPTGSSSGGTLLGLLGFTPAIIIILLYVLGLLSYVLGSSIKGLKRIDEALRT